MMGRIKSRFVIALSLICVVHVTHAELKMSRTSSLQVQFSPLLPPFITWKNRDENINIPFSVGSSTSAAIEISTQVGPACPSPGQHANAVCMSNASDPKQVIHYTIKYTPCGSLKPFYLSDRNHTHTKIVLNSSYTNWDQCKASPGVISFTRLSLFEKPLPSSGLYSGSITLELREI
jgi:hypothetical protein